MFRRKNPGTSSERWTWVTQGWCHRCRRRHRGQESSENRKKRRVSLLPNTLPRMPRVRPLTVLKQLSALIAGVVMGAGLLAAPFPASPAPTPASHSAAAQSDLDTFMEKVLSRRDDN